MKQVARELGVRYVLEGSVRKAGRSGSALPPQLIDAETGTHLWADRFDGSLYDVFDLQDKAASSVAGVIEPALRAAEIQRSSHRPTHDLTAYDLYLRALPEAGSRENTGFAEHWSCSGRPSSAILSTVPRSRWPLIATICSGMREKADATVIRRSILLAERCKVRPTIRKSSLLLHSCSEYTATTPRWRSRWSTVLSR